MTEFYKDAATGLVLPKTASRQPGTVAFAVGDVVEVKGCLFKVRQVKRKDLVLRPFDGKRSQVPKEQLEKR